MNPLHPQESGTFNPHFDDVKHLLSDKPLRHGYILRRHVEDLIDREGAKKSRKEGGSISLAELKIELGI